ncbi:MAG: hydroxymethylbilane synthase [Cyclobacteriaceae bacterium]|nr:hydroxymethylbilane synthase [Cyclobacteriaceae bacterium]
MIRIGTRKSKLALWQAEWVADTLRNGGLEAELLLMETKGDKILDVSISKIGSKGVFTEELEEKLASNEIDIAVHSAKDMQSKLPQGFELLAFSEREGVQDVLVSDSELNLDKPLVLGTSSTRRVAFLKHFYPHHSIVDMRGNLQTRMEKMRSGHCDALVLAYAGVHRMGYDEQVKTHLPITGFVPAVGQGSIAIECHGSLDPDKKAQIRQLLNHEKTEQALLAERAYLAAMDGGCSIPVFGLATVANDQISLTAGIISLDGQRVIKHTLSGTNLVELGNEMATWILANGGLEILAQIKREINESPMN